MRLLLLALGGVFPALILVVAGYLAMYPFLYPTYSHRYRLTLEVETPEGLKTASGVIQASLISQPTILTDRNTRTGLQGDAVFLDLGNGQNVIALLGLGPWAQKVDETVTRAVKAFECEPCQLNVEEWQKLSRRSGTRELPQELLATLVTISDFNDPSSVRVVPPSDFETVFGPGYHFKRAWIEMTKDPVTRGIREKIPFLSTHHRELTKVRAMGAEYTPQLGQFTVGGD